MKNLLLLMFCLFMVGVLPSEAQNKKQGLPKESSIEIPNCIWNDKLQLFVEQTEVANIHWKEYCSWVQESKPEEYLNSLPDTTVWWDLDKYADVYVVNYFRYLGFSWFPVVGVTKKQVEEYTKWRSKKVTEYYNNQNRGLAKNYVVEITYRLPTENEWMVLASAPQKKRYRFKGKYNWTKKIPHKRKKEMKNGWLIEAINCKMPYDSVKYIEQESMSHRGRWSGKERLYRISKFVFDGFPNEFNLYNILGNVAEMVQEEGIAKGGSWFHTPMESTIKERQIYKKPTAWLGFRCVAIVKLTPKKEKKQNKI